MGGTLKNKEIPEYEKGKEVRTYDGIVSAKESHRPT